MDKILLPTDFSDEGIAVMEQLFDVYQNKFEILFTHLFFLPTGIQDLLFEDFGVDERKYVTDKFLKAYFNCVKNSGEDLNKIVFPIKFFHGNTLFFFRNFLSANKITHIAYSSANPLKGLNSKSIDPLKVIYKCRIPLIDTANYFQFNTK